MLDLKERCKTCLGAKKIMSTGLLQKVCSNCNGIGWLELKPQTAEDKAKFEALAQVNKPQRKVYTKRKKVDLTVEDSNLINKPFSTDDNNLVNG